MPEARFGLLKLAPERAEPSKEDPEGGEGEGETAGGKDRHSEGRPFGEIRGSSRASIPGIIPGFPLFTQDGLPIFAHSGRTYLPVPRENAGPMRILKSIWRFTMSIRFGVALILALMVVMMFATQFEASTSTRAMKHFIYGSAWFDAGVFLFVVNLVVNTLRRRPYGFRHAGFLTVHVGVLTIVAGGLATRWFGIDGTMPIPEGSTSRAILLPESDLVVEAGGAAHRFTTHYDLEPWRQNHDDVFEIPGTKYAVRIDRYYPTGAVSDTLVDSASGEGPIVQVAVGNGASEPISGWLVARSPEQSFADVSGVRVHLAESDRIGAIEESWMRAAAPASGSAAKASAPANAGTLRLVWADGGMENLVVPAAGDAVLPTTRPGIRVHVDQVFRAFVLTDDGFAEGEGAAPNPAIRFHLVAGGGSIEEHFSFAQFPEFRMSPNEGEEHLLSHADWIPSPDALAAGGAPRAREIAFEWMGTGVLVTHTSWEDPLDGTPIGLGETRRFASAGVVLRVLQAAADGRVARTVEKVSDEVMNPVVHVRLEVESAGPIRHAGIFDLLRGGRGLEPANVDPNRAWVFHGTEHAFATPDGPIRVRYESRRIPLEFGIELNDFIEKQYPGVALAASYESHVRVVPGDGEPFPEKIYMNHPLKYAGFTFYQASFQRTPEGETTVLSVARDPGMTVSFVGYCILVFGLLVIFFVKPTLRRLDDRIARSRAAAKGTP